MLDARTKKILQAITRHCGIIAETKEHFGMNYAEFEDNVIYQNAVLTPVTQIGELVKRLPDEFKQKHNGIPWKNISGMRDVIVHSYETIDKLILWNVADTEIKRLRKFCIEVLKKE